MFNHFYDVAIWFSATLVCAFEFYIAYLKYASFKVNKNKLDLFTSILWFIFGITLLKVLMTWQFF